MSLQSIQRSALKSFEWSECFVTGIPMVDTHHRRLVEIINRFGALVLRTNEVFPGEVEQVLDQLTTYARFHFTAEEKLMVHSGLDPEYVAGHQAEHGQFFDQLRALRTRQHDNPASAHQLLEFLIHWLAYHILGVDQVMVRRIGAISNGTPAPQACLASDREGTDTATTVLVASLEGIFAVVGERNKQLAQTAQTLEGLLIERTRELEAQARELAAARRALDMLAMADPLTGALNGRFATTLLEREWRTPLAPADRSTACIAVDLDYGRLNEDGDDDAGERMLKLVAAAILRAVRTDDLVCRMGGGEFVAICNDLTEEDAIALARKVHDEVGTVAIAGGGREWRAAASVGVAVRGAHTALPADLLACADDAVLAAKTRPVGDKVALYEASTRRQPAADAVGGWASSARQPIEA